MYINDIEKMISSYKGLMGVTSWLYYEEFSVFIRITKHLLHGDFCETIDISNISVHSEYQKQGVFKQFLADIESLAVEHNKVVYVESILNDHLLNYLVKKDYTITDYESKNAFKKFK